MTDWCFNTRSGTESGAAFSSGNADAFGTVSTKRGLSPVAGHGRGPAGSANAGHGHFRHFLPGRVPAPVGRARPHRHPQYPPAHLRNLHHALPGRSHLIRKAHVFRPTQGNAALLCLHRIPVSCLQESLRLLPYTAQYPYYYYYFIQYPQFHM